MIVAALPLVTSALAGLAPSAGAAASAAASSASGGFGQVMDQVSAEAVKSMRAAETAAVSGIEGKTSTQDVVQSVMAAQESLQTALAVRDKSVAAFQEISRMAI